MRHVGRPTTCLAPVKGGTLVNSSRVLGALLRGDVRTRTLASRLDLARSVGPAYFWRRVREERALPPFGRRTRDALYRRLWEQAADVLEAELVDLSNGLYEIRRGGTRTRVWQQVVPLDDPVTLRVALDKAIVHRLLEEAAISVPDHVLFHFRDPRGLEELLDALPGPRVIKPAASGGGGGGTAGIETSLQLARAWLRASRHDEWLLAERQVEGTVYRLLFLDGEVVDVVRNLPPRLTGDGRSTIEGLIAAENRRRIEARGWAGLSLLRVTLDTIFTLERAGLRLSSVLEAGKSVAVQTVTNDNRVEDSETVHDPPAPEVVATARAAVDAVGLRLAGVDLVTRDPQRPLSETGGAVIEVNGNPGLHHHYVVADPARATPVAVPVLERLLEGADSAPGKAIEQRGLRR